MKKSPPIQSKKLLNRQSGFVVLLALIFLGITMAAAAALFSYTTLNLRGSRLYYAETQALYLAQAGVDKAIDQLNQNGGYTGESGTILIPGEFSVSVSTMSGNKKLLTATGYVPSSANPVAILTIKAIAAIDTNEVAFNYGVQVGEGGLEMDNNSVIDGNVFSNGNIIGGNGDITGDAIVALGTVASADQAWEVNNQNFQFGHTATVRDVAQSFKPAVNNTLNTVAVNIKKVGTPGDLTVMLLSDSAGSPSRTVLASANIDSSSVTDVYGWIGASFTNPPTLVSGTSYWLALSTSSSSGSNYYYWASDSNNGDGNGVGKYSNNWNTGSPTWTIITGDLNYRTFMGGVITYFDSGIDVGGNVHATEIRDCGSVVGVAYYTTTFTNCTGTGSGGTLPPGPQTMPVSDAQIADWKQVAENGGGLTGNQSITGTQNMGPQKNVGDLTITNGSTLVLTGPIWVKGNILIENNATLKISAALGDSGTVLVADNPDNYSGSGLIDVENGAIIQGNGNPSSFPLILTTSTNAINAIFLKNNSLAAIYYASAGTIYVSQQAGGNQLTGYKIYLEENAHIEYVSGLANSNFTNGPGASWKFQAGSYVIQP